MAAWPARADAVVIGGGIIGIASAYALVRDGANVVLLEAGRLAEQATGSSFAWLNATSKTADAHYHRLNALGLERHDAWAAALGLAAEAPQGPGDLQWSSPATPDGPARIESTRQRLRELGYPLVPLSRDELLGLEPGLALPEGAVGFHAPADRWLDGPGWTAAVAEAARGRGAQIVEGQPVLAIEPGPEKTLRMYCHGGQIDADSVLIAAGTETARLAALALGGDPPRPPFAVNAVPGLLLDLPADLANGAIRHTLHAPDLNGLHARPGADGGLRIGAEDSIAWFETRDRAEVLARGPADMLGRLKRLLPDLPHDALARRARARIGVRPMPADGLPIVGPLARDPRVHVAVSHSGITLGPLFGDLIAHEVLGGRPDELLAPYRPSRFQDG